MSIVETLENTNCKATTAGKGNNHISFNLPDEIVRQDNVEGMVNGNKGANLEFQNPPLNSSDRIADDGTNLTYVKGKGANSTTPNPPNDSNDQNVDNETTVTSKGANSTTQSSPSNDSESIVNNGTSTTGKGANSTTQHMPNEIIVFNMCARDSGIFVQASIHGKALSLLIDSGADVTILGTKFVQSLDSGKIPKMEEKELRLVSATGDPIPFQGECEMPIKLGKYELLHKVLVGEIRYDGILGLDFMTQHACDILVGKMTLKVKGQNLPCLRYGQTMESNICRVAIAEDISIPANSEFLAPGRIIDPIKQGSAAIVEPNIDFVGKCEVLVARTLVDPSTFKIPLRIMNPTDKDITLYRDSCIATLENVSMLPNVQKGMEISSIEVDTNSPTLPEHLVKTYKESSGIKEEVDKRKLKNLLLEYQSSFSKSSQDMGLTDLAEHTIETGNTRPIKQAPRRIPLAKMQEVDQEIKDMLDKGVIEESESPWSSPVVLVKKKDNSLRFCIDYRKLNEVTLKDSHPIPRIDTTLDSLSGSKFYSTIDLKSGYWQVPVAPNDRPKTAFSIPGGGHWQFITMPFGLCNAPATFERLMEKILSKLSWKICMVYLDDIIIMSKTYDEHIQNLELVFRRLQEANLKMNPKKCKFLQTEVTYLGHIVSEKGIGTDPSKIECVQTWPTPKNVRDIRSFLGLCSYYRRFVHKFADIAKPLHKLTEKSEQFVWTDDCQAAFDKLKRALTSSPILSYPQRQGLYILDTDASNTGMGAVLSQVQEGHEKVICYYSKVFSSAERRYCVTRRELLAVVQSIKHFHHYLYGQTFKVRTDHGALRWLLNFKNPEGQIARWLESLSSYQFVIEHRAGRSHSNADALSRRPCEELDCRHCSGAEVRYQQASCAVVTTRSHAPKEEITPESEDIQSISLCQANDPDLQHVIKWVQTGIKPEWSEISHLSGTCKYYWVRFDSFKWENKTLYHIWEDVVPKVQVVVPMNLTKEIANNLHNSITGGHLGIKKTLSKVRDKYFWHNMSKDIKHLCKMCDTCASRKSPNKVPKAPLQKYVVGVPMERWAVDVIGPLPLTNKRNSYLLVVGDYFTKWVDAIPMRNQKAITIAQKLVDRVVTIFGVPMELHSDQGPSFESNVFQEMCKILGIHKTRTTPYRPQSDGMIERANQTIENMLSAFVSTNKRDWDEHIPLLMLAYRAAVHESIGVSPAEMVFGRPISLPIDLLLGRVEPEIQNTYETEYANNLSNKIAKIHNFARDKLQIQVDKMLRQYSSQIHLNRYEPGDAVWHSTPRNFIGGGSKLDRNWKGPFIVSKRINDVIYQIKIGPKHKPKTVHHNYLKPYMGNNKPTWFHL